MGTDTHYALCKHAVCQGMSLKLQHDSTLSSGHAFAIRSPPVGL